MLTSNTSIAVNRPKKNSTACLACKAAKRKQLISVVLQKKCSGPPSPCQACVGAGAESDCEFDPSRDLRRKIAVKRTIRELSDFKDILNNLVAKIRSAPQEKVDKIIDLIREDASLEEIAHAVGSSVTQFTDSGTSSTAGQSTEREDGSKYLETSPMERFEGTLDRTSASPEHATESLKAASDPYARVSLESLCDIPIFKVPAKPWTNVTASNDLVSNLISLYFTWDHPCSQFLDQHVFLDHMKRGNLKSEFCSPFLVNSMLAMASAYSDSPDVLSDPDDAFSRGQKFLQEAERLWKTQDGDLTLTNIQALLMMSCVIENGGDSDVNWAPYPRPSQVDYASKPTQLPLLRQSLVHLMSIAVHIQELLCDEELRENNFHLVKKAEQPYNQLTEWLKYWPDASQVGEDPVPHLLIVRIKYRQVIMNLLENLINRNQQGMRAKLFQGMWIEQAKEIAACLRSHRLSYGLKYLPTGVVDVVQTSLRHFVDLLDGAVQSQHAFIELCRFGGAISRRSKPTAVVIHHIQRVAQMGVVTLPLEALAILDESAVRKGSEPWHGALFEPRD
ncbi:Transcription factor [Penicillium macrosclerotiorum]|uniref:Transcription factor n=1 Tax=Penicillium macrosclerotiorum TaxID=303699 RepID=UPI0025497EA2|nr:Transcription factor [Penicillium macrosclerotiorum]KAJ5666950.1 Transcription factor [Penicillium macrosclerotiorum]